MSAEWRITGQISKIKKNGEYYLVDIADNRYYNGKKVDVIFFHCLSPKLVNVAVGDRVIAIGSFQKSYNPNYQYAMMIDSIGIIKDSNNADKCDDEHKKES